MSATLTEPVMGHKPAVEAIVARNAGRPSGLLREKYRRMREDVFAFFRGTDHLFAAGWHELRPVEPGPAIVICGDLHLENFGTYRADDGDFVFDLNDYDEAIVGPCSIDLVRCTTSVLLASQAWGLTPIQATRATLGFVDRYRKTIAEAARGDQPAGLAVGDEFGPIEDLLGESRLATQRKLLDRVTRLDKLGVRSIKHSEAKLPDPGEAIAEVVAEAVESYGRAQGNPEAFRVLDVTSRIAGIGGLGLRRYVALVAGDGTPEGNRLLDIKEVGPSSVQRLAVGPQPAAWTNNARRVVDAQLRLQGKPTAGLDVMDLDGTAFRLRELIPDENRARIDRFRERPSRLRLAVEVAGKITAWSQIRGARLDGEDRTGELVRWAASAALDSVLASAVRFADRTRADYKAFRKARLDRME